MSTALRVLIICLPVLLFIFFAWLFYRNFLYVREAVGENGFGASFREMWRGRGRIQPPEAEVDVIAPWVTFHYINIIFALPESYLKDVLKISDKRYPNITIRQYARDYALDESRLVGALKQAVQDYLSAHKP